MLGILPFGTVNSFARTLGIPLDLKGAVEAIVNGKVIDVDLGKVEEVVIANGRHFGVTPLAQSATADDRELTVFVMDTPNRWHTLKLWIVFLLGKATIFPQARFFNVKEVKLEASPPQCIEVDGEITAKTPVNITLVPEALMVMVPGNLRDISLESPRVSPDIK
ncbi:MAG: Diacylglycerol kinase [Pelotomaculum sp. PtaB.Bin013]|nr:MAG: Diacylglycerol kinase [Pelotomaculum sp. PtaB.Bin013]